MINFIFLKKWKNLDGQKLSTCSFNENEPISWGQYLFLIKKYGEDANDSVLSLGVLNSFPSKSKE